jgi:hypothetical protein
MNDIEEPIAPQVAEDSPHDRKAEDEESGLRSFCARILGWADEHAGAVEHAIRSIHLSVAYRAALVLLGDTDLVPIARALHRRTIGGDRPFIVCDRRRRNLPASVRSPRNHESGVDAFQAARGGSLCIRRKRLPHDFSSVVARLRRTDDVQLIVCSDGRDDAHPFLTLPVPIRVPSLRVRASELPRIVDEYAVDAIAELRPLRPGFTAADRQWVLEHTPLSLSEIEKATLRLVAIRASRNMSGAAARLGMAPVSLSRWIARRKQPSQFGHDQGEPEQETDNHFESVSTVGVLSNGGDLLDAKERAELAQELEASFTEEDAGQLVDVADVIAELKAIPDVPKPSDRSRGTRDRADRASGSGSGCSPERRGA